MRQNNGAADLLVGMAAVDAELDVDFDGLVKLGGSGLYAKAKRLVDIVKFGSVDLLEAVDIFLPCFIGFPPC